jgi:hypothetical protein
MAMSLRVQTVTESDAIEVHAQWKMCGRKIYFVKNGKGLSSPELSIFQLCIGEILSS